MNPPCLRVLWSTLQRDAPRASCSARTGERTQEEPKALLSGTVVASNEAWCGSKLLTHRGCEMFKGETFVFHPQNMCFYPGPFFPPSILCSKVYIGGVFLRPTLPGTSSWANAVGGKRPRRLGFSHVRLQTCGASPTSMILLESVSTCISLYIYIYMHPTHGPKRSKEWKCDQHVAGVRRHVLRQASEFPKRNKNAKE